MKILSLLFEYLRNFLNNHFFFISYVFPSNLKLTHLKTIDKYLKFCWKIFIFDVKESIFWDRKNKNFWWEVQKIFNFGLQVFLLRFWRVFPSAAVILEFLELRATPMRLNQTAWRHFQSWACFRNTELWVKMERPTGMNIKHFLKS